VTKKVQAGTIVGGFTLADAREAGGIFDLPGLDPNLAVASFGNKRGGVSKFILLKSPTCCV
jgi:hypothetical protein